jgi:glycosyltransferase involved in cell wall biosynthesis
VLAQSFLEHHPGASFVTLVIDGEDSDCSNTPGLLLPADLGLPRGQWEQMAGIYSLMELATALKPALLRHLLADVQGAKAVLYLDPDIVVYRPFPEVFTVAERAGLALTPHVLHPLPRDGLEPDETYLMHAGLFNLGFMCAGRGGLEFLDWWHERLLLDAVVDLPNALFTDQRWVDWVPSLFGGEVLRDHGLNVAYWNLHERPLAHDGDGQLLAAGEPLKFFHFSGYAVDRPWQLSKHAAARPRCRLLDYPLVARLCNEYSESLAAAGSAQSRGLAYGLGRAPNDLSLTPVVRAAYRNAIKEAAKAGAPSPPAPFDADGGTAFAQWLMAPAIGPPDQELGAWHLQLWRSRPDLQAAFPDIDGLHAPAFRSWFDHDPSARELQDELCLPAALQQDLSARRSPRPARERASYGWNVVGHLSAELGVGEAGRRMNMAIEGAGIATRLVSVAAPLSRQQHRLRGSVSRDLHYQDTLYCVNADQLERVSLVAEGPTPDRTTGRRVGLWFWELDEFPQRWHRAFDLVDEVWCASPFTAEAVRAEAPVPVRLVPLPVPAPGAPTPFSRHQLGLPEGFVFLFSYDFHSVFERKNPLGLIEAYTRAFGPDDGATLVLKSINGAHHQGQLDRARYAAGDRPDIVIFDGYLDAARAQALIEQCDCFVSLHRSEGFGLHLAAAMAAGRPVIATGYSGNMAYMGAGSAFLVPYELVPVGPGNDPYPERAHWAAPDLEAAATLMRWVFDHPAVAGQVAERGRRDVLSTHGLGTASAAVGRLLLGAELDWVHWAEQEVPVLASVSGP